MAALVGTDQPPTHIHGPRVDGYYVSKFKVAVVGTLATTPQRIAALRQAITASELNLAEMGHHPALNALNEQCSTT